MVVLMHNTMSLVMRLAVKKLLLSMEPDVGYVLIREIKYRKMLNKKKEENKMERYSPHVRR